MGEQPVLNFFQPPAALQATPERLAAQKEAAFQQWWRDVRAKQGMNPNTSPDDPLHFYDNRAFYDDMIAGKPGIISPDKPGGHFPSDYKLPGHPRTYLEDGNGKVFHTPTGKYLTGEPVPPEQLKASEKSPDMPGFDPEKAALIAALYKPTLRL